MYNSGHFAVSLLPMMIFGPLSLASFLYATLLDCGRQVLTIIRNKPVQRRIGTLLMEACILGWCVGISFWCIMR
jgi:hypothetical protein